MKKQRFRMRLMTWRAVFTKVIACGRIRETRRAAAEAQLAYHRCSADFMVRSDFAAFQGTSHGGQRVSNLRP